MMDTKALARLQADPAEFRMALRIDAGADGTKLLGRCLDPWQARDFGSLDAGWQRIAGQKITAEGPTYLRAYLERGRGHSKTADVATMATYALFASRRKINGVAAAGTKDQARFILDAISRLVQLNPWLRTFLDVQASKVVNKHTGSELAVIAAEASTSYGLLVDFILIDEITHWPASGEALWHSLFSAAAKRASCMLAIIANAGLGAGVSWQWKLRESFRTSPDFYFSRLEGPVASWITPANLEEQRRMLPPGVYARLWGNVWQSGSSDVLTDEDIDLAMILRGPCEVHQIGTSYVMGVDLGLSHDAAAAVLLGKSGTPAPFYTLVNGWEWKPPIGGKVSISAIEEMILQAHATYRLSKVAVDPWNAAQLVERLRKQDVPIAERQQAGARLVEQASATIALFRSRSIALYDWPPLTRDLRMARIEERPYGYRFIADRGPHGHGDRLTALSIAAAESKSVAVSAGEIHLQSASVMFGAIISVKPFSGIYL